MLEFITLLDLMMCIQWIINCLQEQVQQYPNILQSKDQNS